VLWKMAVWQQHWLVTDVTAKEQIPPLLLLALAEPWLIQSLPPPGLLYLLVTTLIPMG